MSTFDGIIDEFPEIRIDYFRQHPGRKPPAACFLSHIHSDHLLGLESLKMPFVYCSAATRRLLLKMEKYPHRINFSKGILEARKQTYKHLKFILRPLPLQTPVALEVGPRTNIQVTLFDANHCPGAVMFLIESDDRAVLYTGDVRAEPWWVNSVSRSPAFIPYAAGQKCLDCLYLDTTFASRQDIHRDFPTKADGLAELAQKLSKCSKDSIFYFRAWTLGYEDAWKLLNNTLHSQIHVDQYQMRLFRGIAEDGLAADPGPAFAGFPVGNVEQAGMLTTDSSAKIHSCVPGMPCHVSLKKNKNTVWITPIISRLRDGTEIAEVGAGGGGGDLYQTPEVDLGNDAIIEALRTVCENLIHKPDVATRLERMLAHAKQHQSYRRVLDGLSIAPEAEITIKELLFSLANEGTQPPRRQEAHRSNTNVIRFPYSRHSSYNELRHFVAALKPRDICPCTVDVESWDESQSMASLFGDLCSNDVFKHDKQIREVVKRRRMESSTTETPSQRTDSQRTETASSQGQNAKVARRSADQRPLPLPQTNTTTPTTTTTNGEHEPKTITAQEALRDAWRAANDGHDTYQPEPIPPPDTSTDDGLPNAETRNKIHPPDLQHSPRRDSRSLRDQSGDGWREANNGQNTYFCNSTLECAATSPRVCTSNDEDQVVEAESTSRNQSYCNYNVFDLGDESEAADLIARQRAFNAAQQCLLTGDDSTWRELRIRCLGWKGHAEEEMLL